MRRRDFLRTAGGATAAGVAGTSAAPAAAQEGNESGGGNQTGGNQTGGGSGGQTVSKTVAVGPGGELVFDPETVTVTPGSTVTWNWDSDTHNIVVENQPEGANWEGTEGPPSKTYDTGHTYEHTFETLGTYDYFCQPHKSAGMVGAVEVKEGPLGGGEGGGGGGEKEPEEMGVPIRAHYVGAGAVLATAITLVFTFFQLKYGESPHASGGGN